MASINDVRDYWNSSPCFTKRSSAPRGSEQFMRETSERKFISEPMIPKFAEYEKWAGKMVLEIGCGIGIDAVNFARAGAWVHAVDVSEKSLDIARSRANLAKVDINFFRLDAENLKDSPIEHCYYDLIYAFGSIHHSPDPQEILMNLRTLARRKTTLKLMVYNKYSWKALWILLKYGKGKFWKFSELIARYSEAQTGCPVTHVYSKRQIKKLVESAGFRVKSIQKDHIFKFDIPAYIKHEYKVAAPWKWMPERMFRWFETHFGWHLLVEGIA